MNEFLWLSCNLCPFSVPSVFFEVQQTDAAMRAGWSPAAIGVKAIYTSAFGAFGTN